MFHNITEKNKNKFLPIYVHHPLKSHLSHLDLIFLFTLLPIYIYFQTLKTGFIIYTDVCGWPPFLYFQRHKDGL